MSNLVAGIVFANVNDELMPKLTSHRAMASVPFGGRYRLIDFPLSNLVNAGVSNIGLVIKEKYRSLLDHVGSGLYWDLDRKNGGIRLMPPYNTRKAKRYSGYIEALYGAIDFIKRSNAEYIVTYNSDIVANVDISSAVNSHIKNSADITVIYTNGKKPQALKNSVSLNFGENGKVKGINVEPDADGNVDYSMGIVIFSRDIIVKIIKNAYDTDCTEVDAEGIAELINKLNVYGFCHEGFSMQLASEDCYYNANMKLLDVNVRRELFREDRPILTKTRDDMPTRYGTKSLVKNSFIADGCVVEGTVKNSVLFRGVKVEKGAVVENSILMQGTSVSKDTVLDHVVSDKNAVIGEGMVIKGTQVNNFFIEKNQTL